MPQNSRDAEAGSRQSQGGNRQGGIPEFVQRDNQQIQDDNQTSGESVLSGQWSGDNRQPIGNADTPNPAANKEPAEGSRENVNTGGNDDAGGISNRPLSEEENRQHNLPPRGEAKDGSHA
jgi:hypothetical protein